MTDDRHQRIKEALDQLEGRTIAKAAYYAGTDNDDGEHDGLVILCDDGYTVSLKTTDSSGYQSWLKLAEKENVA